MKTNFYFLDSLVVSSSDFDSGSPFQKENVKIECFSCVLCDALDDATDVPPLLLLLLLLVASVFVSTACILSELTIGVSIGLLLLLLSTDGDVATTGVGVRLIEFVNFDTFTSIT